MGEMKAFIRANSKDRCNSPRTEKGRGDSKTDSLEQEVNMLRAELAAAKLQIAQLAGENDQLSRAVLRLGRQQTDASWWPPFLPAPPNFSSRCSLGAASFGPSLDIFRSGRTEEEASSSCATETCMMPAALAGFIAKGKAQSLFTGFSNDAMEDIRMAMREQCATRHASPFSCLSSLP